MLGVIRTCAVRKASKTGKPDNDAFETVIFTVPNCLLILYQT
jgi:hypothetical protein